MVVKQDMGVGHMGSLNVILTKYMRVLPDTIGLIVKMSQRGSPGAKDAHADATCQLEAIV
jgi:hypothetical protein